MKNTRLQTRVIACSIFPRHSAPLPKNVTISFTLKEVSGYVECCFYLFPRKALCSYFLNSGIANGQSIIRNNQGIRIFKCRINMTVKVLCFFPVYSLSYAKSTIFQKWSTKS